MFLTMFIIGHVEIGNGYCRTDIMLHNEPIAMEYPCEYYSELHDLDNKIKLLGQ